MKSRRETARDVLNSWRIGARLAIIKVEAPRWLAREVGRRGGEIKREGKNIEFVTRACAATVTFGSRYPCRGADVMCIGNFASRASTFLSETPYPFIAWP